MRPDLGPVGELDGDAWREVLGLAAGERPAVVIVEGSWWRDERTKRRLARLDTARELGVPDVHLGRLGDAEVIYACPYGSPRTAEVVHIAALVGARLAVQIGSCGVIGAGVRPGDVVVPSETLALDGVTPLYSGGGLVPASAAASGAAIDALSVHDVTVHRGPSVTWPTLFNQPLEVVRGWREDGYLGVDMETATTLAVARHFGIRGVSMLVAWDEVLSDRSFLDPLPDDLSAAFKRSEDLVYEVALELALGEASA